MNISFFGIALALITGSIIAPAKSRAIRSGEPVTAGDATFKSCNGENDIVAAAVPADPIFKDYTFDGWYNAQTGGEKQTSFTSGSTYYAHYSKDGKPVLTEGLSYSAETNKFTAAVTGEIPSNVISTYGLEASNSGNNYTLSFNNFVMDVSELFKSAGAYEEHDSQHIYQSYSALEILTFENNFTCNFTGTNIVNAVDKRTTLEYVSVVNFFYSSTTVHKQSVPDIVFEGSNKNNDKFMIDASKVKGAKYCSVGLNINSARSYYLSNKFTNPPTYTDNYQTFGNDFDINNITLDVVAPSSQSLEQYGIKVRGMCDPGENADLPHFYVSNSNINVTNVEPVNVTQMYGIFTAGVTARFISSNVYLTTTEFTSNEQLASYIGYLSRENRPGPFESDDTYFDRKYSGLFGEDKDPSVLDNTSLMYFKDTTFTVEPKCHFNPGNIYGILYGCYVIFEHSNYVFTYNANQYEITNIYGLYIGSNPSIVCDQMLTIGIYLFEGSKISITNGNFSISVAATIHLYDGKIELLCTTSMNAYSISSPQSRNSNPILHYFVSQYLSSIGGKYIISDGSPDTGNMYWMNSDYFYITRGPQLTIKPLPTPVPEEITYNGEDINVDILEVEPDYFDEDTMELTIQYKKGRSQAIPFTEDAPQGIEGSYDSSTHRVSLKITDEVQSDDYVFRVTNGLADNDPAFVKTDNIEMKINGLATPGPQPECPDCPTCVGGNADVEYKNIVYQPIILFVLLVGALILYFIANGIYLDKKNDKFEEQFESGSTTKKSSASSNKSTKATKVKSIAPVALIAIYNLSHVVWCAIFLTLIIVVLIKTLITFIKMLALNKSSINKASDGAKNAADKALNKIYELVPFQKRIHTADPELQAAYNELKSEAVAYGLTSSVSKTGDLFSASHKQIFKITIAGKHLKLYYALDPTEYSRQGLSVGDATGVIAHAETPLIYKVQSNLSIKRAKLLLEDVAKTASLKKKAVEQKDWVKEIPIPEKKKEKGPNPFEKKK